MKYVGSKLTHLMTSLKEGRILQTNFGNYIHTLYLPVL